MRGVAAPTLSRQILVGLVAGIATGLFFGELVAPLKVVADGFVKLLQMTVLPYVVVSIVTSLGSLSFDEARRLGLRAGAVLVGLWLLGLAAAFALPLAFPDVPSGAFFSTSLVQPPDAFDFVGLYIPSNPFYSLANNVVPAVVLFSVIVGVALIGVERKALLIGPLAVAGEAIARATRAIVRLTPYGLFAIAATAAGTLDLREVARLQVYLISYISVALLLALWVLPGLVVALTAIPYREVFGPARDALITAFMAGDLFIVLPGLIESSRQVLARHVSADPRTGELPEVVVPASFNFPHTGKLLSLSFVLFAGWFADAGVPLGAYPRLALAGLLSFFGSLNAAVPFLLDAFRIPADTFQLFLATSVINARFGTLVAAVHTLVVALLGSAAVAGAVRFEPRRLARFAAITVVLGGATLGGLHLLFGSMLAGADHSAAVSSMTPTMEHDPSVMVAVPPAPDPPDARPVLDVVRARGMLRVALVAQQPPYAFHNANGELVGIDVELTHLLARDLQVQVEYVPATYDEAVVLLASGACDMAMGGVAITPLRSLDTRFTQAYLDETMAFLVKDHLRARFKTWADIDTVRDLRVGVPGLKYVHDPAARPRPAPALRGARSAHRSTHRVRAVRRGAVASRARLDAHAARSAVVGGGARARGDQGAGGLPGGPPRRRVGGVPRHLDRLQAQGRHAGAAVHPLDPRPDRNHPHAAVVGDTQRAALGRVRPIDASQQLDRDPERPRRRLLKDNRSRRPSPPDHRQGAAMKFARLLLVLPLLLSIVACEPRDRTTGDKVKDKVDDALDRRSNEKLRDAGEDVRDGATDAAKDVGGAVKDTAKDVKDGAKKK